VTGINCHGGFLVAALIMPAFQTGDIHVLLYVTPLVNC